MARSSMRTSPPLPVTLGENPILLWLFRDITERNRAERALPRKPGRGSISRCSRAAWACGTGISSRTDDILMPSSVAFWESTVRRFTGTAGVLASGASRR